MDFDGVFPFVLDEVLGAGVHGNHEDLVVVNLVARDDDDPFALEHPLDASGSAHVAAELLEDVADVGDGALGVVGEDTDHERDSVGSVAFIQSGLVGDAVEFAGALFDGAFDVVFGHLRVFGLVYEGAESGVHVGVATAVTGRHGDHARELAERARALGVLAGLAMYDVGPFGMSCHVSGPPSCGVATGIL